MNKAKINTDRNKHCAHCDGNGVVIIDNITNKELLDWCWYCNYANTGLPFDILVNMKDCTGQPINPVKDILSVHKNAHQTTDGYDWGWIDGCEHNVVWNDKPSSSFTSDDAYKIARAYNHLKQKQHGQNTY